MNDRQIESETERKNAEIERQRELAERTVPDGHDEKLKGQDKIEADSFPASDAPAPP